MVNKEGEMGKIAITYEECKVGHEAVVHKTVKYCPLCELSIMSNKAALLRGCIDAVRNLCEDYRTRTSDTVKKADVLKTIVEAADEAGE